MDGDTPPRFRRRLAFQPPPPKSPRASNSNLGSDYNFQTPTRSANPHPPNDETARVGRPDVRTPMPLRRFEGSSRRPSQQPGAHSSGLRVTPAFLNSSASSHIYSPRSGTSGRSPSTPRHTAESAQPSSSSVDLATSGAVLSSSATGKSKPSSGWLSDYLVELGPQSPPNQGLSFTVDRSLREVPAFGRRLPSSQTDDDDGETIHSGDLLRSSTDEDDRRRSSTTDDDRRRLTNESGPSKVTTSSSSGAPGPSSGDETRELGPTAEEEESSEEEPEPSSDPDAETELQGDGDRLLSLFVGGGRLGAALLDTQGRRFRLLADLPEDPGDLRHVRSLLAEIQPSAILVSGSADEELDSTLQTFCTAPRAALGVAWAESGSLSTSGWEADASEEEEEPTQLRRLPPAFFAYPGGLARIQNLMTPQGGTSELRDLKLKFSIDVNAKSMMLWALLRFEVRSFGALLQYLVTTPESAVPVDAVDLFTVQHQMHIDAGSFEALQIFAREWHPSLVRGGWREGNSLLRLLDRCRSKGGRWELRRWLLRPVSDRDVLNARLDAVEFFAEAGNRPFAAACLKVLPAVAGLTNIYRRMQRAQSRLNDWLSLRKTVMGLRALNAEVERRRPAPTLLRQLGQHFEFLDQPMEELDKVGELLEDWIDFGVSKSRERLKFRQGIDYELDQQQMLMSSLPGLLQQVADTELSRIGRWVQSASVVYIPLVGYLLSIHKDAILDPRLKELVSRSTDTIPSSGLETTSPDSWGPPLSDEECVAWRPGGEGDGPCDHLPRMTYLFTSSDGRARYRSPVMRELDAEMGDVESELRRLEIVVTVRLVRRLLGYFPGLLAAGRLAAQLDCLISLGLTAGEQQWSRPELVDEAVLDVAGAVHPLLELAAEEIVGNPISSGLPGKEKVSILMGPNTCGKSVYLKTVGLVAYMAHIGSFVPARTARIGALDRLHTRIHTVDSVLDGLSTFAKDLNQMTTALRRATGRSLVIVDEFGKGTLNEVGLGLLASSVLYWVGKGPQDCPHLLVSSHLHALANFVPGSRLVTYKTLSAAENSVGELEFYYRLVPGIADFSHAAYAARLAGLPNDIVARGVEVYNCLRSGTRISLPNVSSETETRGDEIIDDAVQRLLDFDEDDDLGAFLEGIRGLAEQFEALKTSSSTPTPARVVEITTPSAENETVTLDSSAETESFVKTATLPRTPGPVSVALSDSSEPSVIPETPQVRRSPVFAVPSTPRRRSSAARRSGGDSSSSVVPPSSMYRRASPSTGTKSPGSPSSEARASGSPHGSVVPPSPKYRRAGTPSTPPLAYSRGSAASRSRENDVPPSPRARGTTDADSEEEEEVIMATPHGSKGTGHRSRVSESPVFRSL